MTAADFDAVLDKALAPKVGGKVKPGVARRRGRISRMVDEQLALARVDTDGWIAANREGINLAARRPRIAKKLAEDVPEFSEAEHAEFMTALADGKVGEWSEEKKAKWHLWVTRIIVVLKVVATFTPPPYSLAIVALIVLLTLIDERRLQPAELAGILLLLSGAS